MTKGEAIRLFAACEAVLVQDHLPMRWAYAVARTRDRMRPIAEAVRASAAPSKEWRMAEKARKAILIDHAEKDEHGQPMTQDNQYRITDQAACRAELEVWAETHRPVLVEQESRAAAVDAMLAEPCDAEAFQCALEDFPEWISGETMQAMIPMVRND